MIFPDTTYSVLIISTGESMNRAFDNLLSRNLYYPVDFAGSIAQGKRILTEHNYDFVIINSPLPDDAGNDFACEICDRKNTAVLMLIKADVCETVTSDVYTHGVFTLSKPTSQQNILTALGWMAATRERLKRTEKKAVSMEERMEEIRLVNRAKWLLIENLSMTEADAHKYIEKQAMDRCITKREVAEIVIRTY